MSSKHDTQQGTKKNNNNSESSQPPFDLRRELYNDGKQLLKNFEENNPDAGKKIAGVSLIAIGTTVLLI